jgi:hypothetical protein
VGRYEVPFLGGYALPRFNIMAFGPDRCHGAEVLYMPSAASAFDWYAATGTEWLRIQPGQGYESQSVTEGGLRFRFHKKQLIGFRLGIRATDVKNPRDPRLVLKTEHLRTHKQVLLRRGTAAPFLLALPELDPKPPAPPKALGSIGIGADEIVIVGDGMGEVEGVTYKEQAVTTFKIVNDQTLRLSGLAALGLTSTAGPQRIFVKFKSDTRPKEVDIQIVNTILTTRQ